MSNRAICVLEYIPTGWYYKWCIATTMLNPAPPTNPVTGHSIAISGGLYVPNMHL